MKILKLIIQVVLLLLAYIMPFNSTAQDLKSQVIDVEDFKELEIEGVFNVRLSQGEKAKVVLTGNDHFIASVRSKNDGNRLSITQHREGSKKKWKKADIHITVRDLSLLTTTIVGNLTTTEELNLKDFALQSSQVGNIDISVKSQSMKMNLSNVGNTKIGGSAGKVKINSSAVGNLDAASLYAQNLTLENSGIGNVKVRAASSLEISSSSIGNVNYHFSGDKNNLDITNSGMGKIKAL